MVEIEGRNYVTTREASVTLGKGQEQVRAWCRNGWIAAKLVGNSYVIPVEELRLLQYYFRTNSVLRKNWKEWVVKEKEDERMKKILFWTGFLTGRFRDIPGITYWRPLVPETLERIAQFAHRENELALEKLARTLKHYHIADPELDVFLSGRMFYIRNADKHVGAATVNPERKWVRTILDHVGYSDMPHWGVAKLDDVYIFVANPEIKNYERFFDRTFDSFTPVEVKDVM